MQCEVVARLVSGIIISSQSLGEGRLILLVHDDRATRPQHKFAIHLIEYYRKVHVRSDLHWDVAIGFLEACYRDSGGDVGVWWKLICGRMREQAGDATR